MSGRLRNLEALRAVAALSVVAFHMQEHAPAILGWPARFGWAGVDVFFVISGLVIPLSIAKLEAAHGPAWPAIYARHRVYRIYPLYVLACIVFVLADPRFLDQPTATVVFQLVTHALMMHWITPETWQGLLWVSWSLAIEAQFYLVIWLIWPLIKRVGPFTCLAACLSVSFAWHFGLRSIWLDPGSIWLSQLPGRLHEFGWGIAAFKILSAPELASTRAVLARGRHVFLVAGPVLFFAWAGGVANELGPLAPVFHAVQNFIGHSGAILLIGASCGLTVFGTALMTESMAFRALAPFGTTSYGTYLWHPIVVVALARTGYSGLSFVLTALSVTLGLAALSYAYLERPLMDSARRR